MQTEQNNTEISAVSFEELPPVLTVPEMAKVLRIGRGSAYELARRGSVPCVRIGKQVRIPRDGLLQWLSKEKAGIDEVA